MNAALLHRLKQAGGSFVPVDELGPDIEATRRDLAELEAFGFALEHHPYLGIAYREPAERLCPDLIEWGLGTEPRRVGHRVAVWSRVESTNDLAAKAASSRANDGLVFLAEEQTSGRGRRGRSWRAPARSSILMSVLLFPPQALDQPIWLTALGAVAVAEVIEAESGQPARIKWPNDVRVRGRKVAGILVERRVGSVLGIGLNVNMGEHDFPPELRERSTSLLVLTGRRADRSEVARLLIDRLDHFYSKALADGPESLRGAWRDRFEPVGRRVRIETTTATMAGRLVAADLLDGLVLEPEGEAGAVRIALDAVVAITGDDAS